MCMYSSGHLGLNTLLPWFQVFFYDAVLVPLVVSIAGEDPVPRPCLTLPFALDPTSTVVQVLTDITLHHLSTHIQIHRHVPVLFYL